MNEIRRRDRDAENVARAREIVQRHELPDFVRSFEIRLGTSDGEPALFVVPRTTDEHGLPVDEVLRRSEEYGRLDNQILPELRNALEERDPYPILVPEDWEGVISH